MQINFFETKIGTIYFFGLDVPKTIPILSASVERPLETTGDESAFAYRAPCLLVGHGVLSIGNSFGY